MVDSYQNLSVALYEHFIRPNFLFSKGRVGLYAVLRAIKIQFGDEIILPGYTCMVVPSAFLRLGAKPVYIDIDPKNYNIDIDKIESRINPKTKAIIIQHTYGIPCEYQSILKVAQENNLKVIEDCCHAFGSRINGHRCGTLGDAAFLSGQWNKPFSTGLGGMLIVNNESLAKKIQELVDRELKSPSTFYNLKMVAQIFLYENVVNPKTSAMITQLYRLASRFGLMVGSSTSGELNGQLPDNYFMGMAPAQAKKGIRELQHIDENIAHRNKISDYYQEELPKIGFKPVTLHKGNEPVFLRYPVRVQNKDKVLAKALRKGVEIGSWFESPMHPEKDDMSKFGYQIGSCPEAEKASKEVINLPTHSKITIREAQRVLEFLQRYAKPC